jgi:hypothetical protein
MLLSRIFLPSKMNTSNILTIAGHSTRLGIAAELNVGQPQRQAVKAISTQTFEQDLRSCEDSRGGIFYQ